MPLGPGETPRLDPITEAGSGRIQEKEKAYLGEIIQNLNDLFEGELTDQDKLVYVNSVIKGKLLVTMAGTQELRSTRPSGFP